MKIKSVSDVIYKIRGFEAGAVMMIGDASPNSKFANNVFFNTSKDRVNGDIGVYLNSYNKRMLIFKAKHFYNDGTPPDENRSVILPAHFYELMFALDICCGWLKLKEYAYLFATDDNDKITGLGGPPPMCPFVQLKLPDYLRFVPAIVVDEVGVKYEGISISNNRGPIIRMAGSEFLSFARNLKSFLSNGYGNYLAMLNTATNMLLLDKLQ